MELNQRFHDELRGQHLPKTIKLYGNPTLVSVATQLLKIYSRDITLAEDGVPIHVMSMEQFGTQFLAHVIEGEELPQFPLLLYTIPEELLFEYAKKHEIEVIQEKPTPVREMLDRIALQQPQTFFSLCKSAQRLLQKTGRLPEIM